MGLTSLLDLEVLLLSHKPKKDTISTSTIISTGRNQQDINQQDINHNWLWHLPPCFSHLTALEHLEASYIGLRSLPDSLGELARLRHLDLSSNMLGWLPNSLVNLKSLEYLDLSQNNISLLPLGAFCCICQYGLFFLSNPVSRVKACELLRKKNENCLLISALNFDV